MASLFTIPSEQPFVDTLAAGLLEETAGDPQALADALVLLPNRRACRSLREAFLRRSGAPALLLPAIQPIGEVDADELILEGGLELDLPPVIIPLRRRLLLARLLQRIEPGLEHALRLAAELAGLLDELQTERLPLEAVDGIVPDQLAAHWQKTRDLLRLLAEHWPKVLAEEGVIEPAEHRHRLLTLLAERWRRDPPTRRIVAAGSTGSIPATRSLLQTILELPRGAVVLPGLDRVMDETSWVSLEPSHPQYGLEQLLEALGRERAEVRPWPAGVAPAGARAHLLREVMRPAATIGAWQDLPPPSPDALRGLAIEDHPDLPGEALSIALRMREALETPARTAALVTPDRALARRVAAELQRWDIDVDDSAGMPLDQTPAGAFLLLTAHLLADGVTPVALLSVLKHPLACGGEEIATFRRKARELERHYLRGPRFVGSFSDLLGDLDAPKAKDRLRPWLERIAATARPFADLAGRSEAALVDLIDAHLAFAEALAADARGAAGELWAREAGEAASMLLAELREAAGDGFPVAPGAYPVLLALLMAERTVRPRTPRHPRLSIWGQLEARLQHADLLLLGGLNETVWPRAVDPGPWLNRTMREQLGLSPVERRIGQSAHDFVQAAGARDVVLSRAAKDASHQPTVPSRWLVRLEMVLGAAGCADAARADTARTRALAHRLDDGGTPRPSPQPRPAPPVAARPRRLSVSDIGTWMRDPYALYARRILELRALDPLEADAGAAERGQIIHTVLERFANEHPTALPADPLGALLAIGREVFKAFAHRPQVGALWWPRFERVARWVVDQEQTRRPDLVEVLAEVEGALEVPGPAGVLRLTTRADRIECRADGGVAIIDYKTGALPKPSEVTAGTAPQLPLEGAIAKAGGFAGAPPVEVAALLYWQLCGDARGGDERRAANLDADRLIEEALRGLAALVAHYDREDTPYPARRPPPNARFRDDYQHLARPQEWPSPK